MSQVCRYYNCRIMTSFVFKKYWKSQEDDWNILHFQHLRMRWHYTKYATLSMREDTSWCLEVLGIHLNNFHSLGYKLTKNNKLTNYIMRRLKIPRKKEKSLRYMHPCQAQRHVMINIAWRGEHGQVGELVNMDPLPWLLPRFLYKLKSLNREPHLFHPYGKSKYIHVQMVIGLHCILHLV